VQDEHRHVRVERLALLVGAASFADGHTVRTTALAAGQPLTFLKIARVAVAVVRRLAAVVALASVMIQMHAASLLYETL